MRKYFIGTFTAKVASLTLTQELEQFPALEESCNTDINDDFIGMSFIHMCTEIQAHAHAYTHTHTQFYFIYLYIIIFYFIYLYTIYFIYLY